MNQVYLDTARLLTQVAPFVFEDGVFALKGGTAINLFIRDMPRLSVDLDLVFIDHHLSRDKALASINKAIGKARNRLEAKGLQVRIGMTADGDETKLFVRRDKIEVKIEVNYVMRGTVHPVQTASLTPKAQEALLADLELPIVSLEDVYGGKLVAAMDRQHPRDLFDVMQLFSNEGITPRIRRSFVVYLASHNRPIHEVLFPNKKDVTLEYEQTFQGMTTEPIELAELLSARERMIAELQDNLTQQERRFLLSIANADPEWSLLEIKHLEQMPAVRWKVQNLRKLAETNPAKLRAQANELALRLKMPL